MKKEIAAAVVLAVLFALTLVNLRALEKLTGDLLGLIDEAEVCAESGDWNGAEEKTRQAETLWQKADPYTHIVVRHSEIDSTTDAFYDLLKALYSSEDGNAKGAFMALRAHLTSISGMEKVTLGSIF